MEIDTKESLQRDAVETAILIVRDVLSRLGRIRRVLVSSEPTGITEYKMTLVADLMDSKRKNIGLVRIYTIVPANGNDITYRIEWTRHVFGFWYRRETKFHGAVDEGIDTGKLKMTLDPVFWTADGKTKIDSMNRMFRRIKKSRVKDRGSRVGMIG